jgi:hypothetical protein
VPKWDIYGENQVQLKMQPLPGAGKQAVNTLDQQLTRKTDVGNQLPLTRVQSGIQFLFQKLRIEDKSAGWASQLVSNCRQPFQLFSGKRLPGAHFFGLSVVAHRLLRTLPHQGFNPFGRAAFFGNQIDSNLQRAIAFPIGEIGRETVDSIPPDSGK